MLSDQSSMVPLYTTLSVGTRWMVWEPQLSAGSSEASKASTSVAVLGDFMVLLHAGRCLAHL